MAEEISSESILANIATQLQTMTTQSSQINTVSVKLPEFWTKSPEVWFARVEAQFGTKGISTDQTKYDFVVSALDLNTAEEVQSVLTNPPTVDKYNTLKTALIKTFGKSQAQKDNELLNMNGLGDKRPTALLRKINALNDDPQTLKRALFLINLPADIRSILAGQNITDTEKLAEAADRIWETRTTNIQQISAFPTETNDKSISEQIQHFDMKPPVVETVAAIKNRRYSSHQGSSTSPSVCFYHQRFGPEARRCLHGCKFASLLSKSNKQGTSVSGNAKAGH